MWRLSLAHFFVILFFTSCSPPVKEDRFKNYWQGRWRVNSLKCYDTFDETLKESYSLASNSFLSFEFNFTLNTMSFSFEDEACKYEVNATYSLSFNDATSGSLNYLEFQDSTTNCSILIQSNPGSTDMNFDLAGVSVFSKDYHWLKTSNTIELEVWNGFSGTNASETCSSLCRCHFSFSQIF